MADTHGTPADLDHAPAIDDRRAFLRKAGLAGAAVAAWSAPQVLSMPVAGAQGSCPCAPTAVNLLAAPFGNGVNVTSGSYAVNGTTMTFARSNTNTITNTTCTPAANWTSGVITNCTAGNISSGQIPMLRVGNGNPQSWTFTMNFAPAVSQLSFTLTDIDASTNSQVQYREEVVISWTNASGTATPQYTPGAGGVGSPPPTNLISTGANAYAVSTTTYNDPATSSLCNLGVAFDCGGLISQVVLTGNDLNTTLGTSGTTGRMVGIAQLAFCTPA